MLEQETAEVVVALRIDAAATLQESHRRDLQGGACLFQGLPFEARPVRSVEERLEHGTELVRQLMPRELLDNTTRIIPGDGIAPLDRILRTLAEKQYTGPLSVELFLPQYQKGNPYEVAREIRQKAEAVMRRARVL